MKTQPWWDLPLESKPDFEKAMKRIYAWYDGEIIDRAPIQFWGYGSFTRSSLPGKSWVCTRDRWFDAEYQVESFIKDLEGVTVPAESFPIYWPNLGPNVYSAFYGAELNFMPTTSWAEPVIHEWEDLDKLSLDWNNLYLKKIEELTACALERCQGKFMVGYTDIHPGVDCVSAWRESEKLCLDLYENPDEVKTAIGKAYGDFQAVYDHFDAMLKSKNQLSATWLGVPSFGKMHVPSNDFSAMISENHFIDFCLPGIYKETEHMTHNVCSGSR